MNLPATQMKKVFDKTLFKETGQSTIIQNSTQEIDPEMGSYIGKPLPNNAIFYIPFDEDINAIFGVGNLNGTAIGGAEVVNNFLDLSFNDNRRVTYGADIGKSALEGAIRFDFIPNYGPFPPTQPLKFFELSQSDSSDNNYLSFGQRDTSGSLSLQFRDKNGGGLISSDFPASSFPFTAGQTYQVEYNFDFTIGFLNVLIGGNLISEVTNPVLISDRDSNINYLSIGVDPSLYKFANVIFFDQIKHTEDYEPSLGELYYATNESTETAVLMQMKRKIQMEVFGEFRPDRFNSYFRYDSTLTKDSIIIRDNEEFKIETYHPVYKAGTLVVIKAILLKVS